MKSLIDLLNAMRRSGSTRKVHKPKAPSKAFLDHAQRELDMLQEQMKNPVQQPKVSAATHTPVLESELWVDDEYWGAPEHALCVDLDQTVDYIKQYRDQSLWLSVLLGLNYDNYETLPAIKWMLAQPDCDALIAVVTFGMLSGPELCGVPASRGGTTSPEVLDTLKTIEAREKTGQHYVANLAPSKLVLSRLGNPDQGAGRKLLEQARIAASRMTKGDEPMLSVPEETLISGGTGPQPFIMHHVDECGIYVVPRLSKKASFQS